MTTKAAKTDGSPRVSKGGFKAGSSSSWQSEPSLCTMSCFLPSADYLLFSALAHARASAFSPALRLERARLRA
ncbi:MAG TPA: hypothetical protein VK400_10475 [Pyrinomonadaceae bacterium]|nr:hypothetical protein [Pyrinomonadaceae bacterium]